MDTQQTERRRRVLTGEDVTALVDAMERRVIDRVERSFGHAALTFMVTWALRVIMAFLIYSAGANGLLKRLFSV